MGEAIKTAEKIAGLSKIAVQIAKEAINTGIVIIRSDERLTLETSTFGIPIRWSIDSVDQTKFLCAAPPSTHAPQFL